MAFALKMMDFLLKMLGLLLKIDDLCVYKRARRDTPTYMGTELINVNCNLYARF